MGHGRKSGRRAWRPQGPRDWGLGLFVDREGYTSVAVACSLLVSLSLVFVLATGQWALSRAADVQEVADATALAGENAVAAFCTVAQVIDACVLTLGISGVVVCAAGLVVAAIPLVRTASAPIIEAGRKILDARREFARSAATGLQKLERALPAIIAANGASCAAANALGGIRYAGVALPFPAESRSDFSGLEDGLDAGELEERARELEELSGQKAALDEQADAARERAWRADNVDDPLCMRSRAESLAGLSGPYNPYYASSARWRFDYARRRAINYYRVRAARESPQGAGVEELTRSRARSAFFAYARDALQSAACVERADLVALDLPELAHNAAMVRDTPLFTDRRWPCTEEDGSRVLHSDVSCPAATGAASGHASLADLEAGRCQECGTCQMDVTAMGRVASASTNIDNGFEHYWRIVVEASEAYEQGKNGSRELERSMQEKAREGAGAFDRAIEILSVARPRLCPPGAYGCVAFVSRPQATETPRRLAGSFVQGSEVPPGAALSGAALAPDRSSDQAIVMRHVLDGVRQRGSAEPLDIVGNVGDLWGELLVGYGSAFENAFATVDGFFDRVGSVFGERAASWLKEHVSDAALQVFDACGLTPADVSLRKPVIVNSQEVLDSAGLSSLAEARRLIQELPDDPDKIADEYVPVVMEQLGLDEYTVAELPIPGMEGETIPLTIDLRELWALTT